MASAADALSTEAAACPCSTRPAANPSTATQAKRSGASGPVVTDAANQSARMPATAASISLGVEPGGMSPQSGGPLRMSSTVHNAPPARRNEPSSHAPSAQVSAVNPNV